MKLGIAATIGDQARVWPIDDSPIRIGRNRSNAIQILANTVSREHAEIALKGDRLLLRDLRSRNGTRLNGVRIRRPVEVRIGDSIQVGSFSLRVTELPPGFPAQAVDTDEPTSTVEIPVAQLLGHKSGAGTGTGELVRFLEEAGRLLVQHRSLRDTCAGFLRTVEMALPTSRLSLVLRQGPDGEPIQVAARSRGHRATGPLELPGEAIHAALDRRTAVITAGAFETPRGADPGRAGAHLTRPAVAVPLLHEGRALGVLYADHDDPGFRYGEDCLEALTLFANMAAVKIANEQLQDAEKKHARIDHELSMASRIQSWLLTAEDPGVEGYEFQAHLEACEEVGGDFYDIQPAADGSVWLMLGDVSGKGICAALLTSLFVSSARVLYEACGDPATLASRLNALLSRRAGIGRFITGFVGRLTPATGMLRYVNAGHPPGVVLAGGGTRRLESTGVPFGVIPDFGYREDTMQLGPGGLLALFSDGLPEARRGREFFGDHRMAGALEAAARCRSLEEAGRNIIGQVDAFLAGQPRQDDISLLLVRREPVQGRENP